MTRKSLFWLNITGCRFWFRNWQSQREHSVSASQSISTFFHACQNPNLMFPSVFMKYVWLHNHSFSFPHTGTEPEQLRFLQLTAYKITLDNAYENACKKLKRHLQKPKTIICTVGERPTLLKFDDLFSHLHRLNSKPISKTVRTRGILSPPVEEVWRWPGSTIQTQGNSKVAPISKHGSGVKLLPRD